MRIATVSWGWGTSIDIGCDVQAYDAADLRSALRDPAVVVVLGPVVTQRVQPSGYLESLDQFGGVVLAIAGCETETTMRWRSSRAVDVVGASDAMDRIERIRDVRPLRRLSVLDWLGGASTGRSPQALRAARVLPRLPRLVAAEWRAAIVASRRDVDRMSRREFGYAPGALLRDYRLGSARALHDAGHPLDDIAPSLGYACKQSLSRALCAHRPLPIRGAHVQNC